MDNSNNRIFSSSFIGIVTLSGNIIWNVSKYISFDEEGESINISFPLHHYYKERHAVEWLKKLIKEKDISWLSYAKGKWLVNLDKMYDFFPDSEKHTWAKGVVEPIVDIEHEEKDVFGKFRKETNIKFVVTSEEIKKQMPKKIFLSHKGVNKPIVRDFSNTLSAIGYIPWLDEDAMVAGESLERALLNGMKQSCAAVFFVTPEYQDENYLATEIDYAIAQKREKSERFSIITLVLKNQEGKKGSVPELLRKYVWKEPENNLQALQEIIRALPVESQGIDWKQFN